MNAALYCRLSREDEDKQHESESIQNQKSLLTRYAREKGWNIWGIFCDEDYSGADGDRPDFQRLIRAAEERQFDIVLVKTQSRFTRDMELVEKYIHGLFPIWGIRFVAVLDNADTAVKGNKKARQINGLINEWYLEDLSENIRAVLDLKRKNGQYIGSFPLYGYQKDPQNKNRLVADPEAAEVVRRIYRLYLDGNGKQQIARLLNAQGIPNPTRYKQLKGWAYVNGACPNASSLWSRTTIGRILHERMYTGDLVQGRRKKASYKSKRLITLPEPEWIVVPDTQEPIIDKQTFFAVSRMLQERTRSSGTGEVHPLAGLVRCMDCQSAMVKASNRCGDKEYTYLRCKLYSAEKALCSSHTIRLDILEAQVQSLLRAFVDRYWDECCMEEIAAGGAAKQEDELLGKEIKLLYREVERRNKALGSLYLDRSQGILDTAQFLELNRAYLAEKTELQKRIALLSSRQLEAGGHCETPKQIAQRLKRWLIFDTLPRELAAEFIDSVEIGERDPGTGIQKIHIHWRV